MKALTTEIMEAVRRGRREGQEEMVCRYAQRVFAMIVRQMPDVMDAQELTQDTFLRAFSHIDSYDPKRASLSTWLCRIAYRLTLDFLKRRRPMIVSIEESQVWQTDISDEELEAELSTGREQRIEQLMEIVDTLPDDERMLLTLYFFKKLKQNFPLKYFLGDNVNAIEVQIWVTMIAYLLLRVMQHKAKCKLAFSNIVTLARLTIGNYVNFVTLLNCPKQAWAERLRYWNSLETAQNTVQLELRFSP